MNNPEIVQPLADLKSPDPEIRYNAILFFARYRECDYHWDFYYPVWDLAENDPDQRVKSAAGIAGSMISARNAPRPRLLDYIPDFLVSWGEVNAGITRDPSPQDWEMLERRMKGDVNDQT